MSTQGFILPDDHAAHENGLIGSVLIDPRVLDKVRLIVSGCDFSDAELGRLFDAIISVNDAGFPIGDTVVLLSKIRHMQNMEFVTAALIGKMFAETPHAGHAAYYAAEIRRTAERRRWYETAVRLGRESRDPQTDPADLLPLVEQHIARISNGDAGTGARSVVEIARALVGEIEANSKTGKVSKPGIFTGLYQHDSVTGPLMPGELCILAARPGCGKTALAMQWAMHVANSSRRTLFVSLEMKDRELVGRLLAPLAGVPSSTIRSQQAGEFEIQSLKAAAESLRETSLVVWDQSRATIQKIKGVAKYVHATGGLEALFVDYLGLIKHDSRSGMIPRHEQIGQMTGELKALAKELEVPIVCLCQLNREADGQTPVLSHLRESGSIEQDADMVLFIHHEKTNDGSNHAKIIVAKNRHGSVGACTVFWIPEETRFTEATGWQP